MSGGEFDGRGVVITGGASGIGEAVARLLADEGARVHLFDLDQARLATLATEIGPLASAHRCDVTDPAALATALAEARTGGRVDGLVCCAGVPDLPGKAEELDFGAWQRVLDSHLSGTLLACRTVGAAMLEDGGGAIVNTASVLSFNAGPVLAYGAAKAAIVNLTSSLAVQWARRGVRVNAVAPGWTDTPFLRPRERGGERDFSPVLSATPVGRLLQAREIANVIAFLLSPRASAIVGTTVACDGGVLAGAGWAPYGGIPGQDGAMETAHG